jgi:hypothetical protein
MSAGENFDEGEKLLLLLFKLEPYCALTSD